MAKKKHIATLVAVAAVAALFVPYKVDVDKDEDNKVKTVITKSVALGLTYSPARDEKESNLDIVVPGISLSKCKVKCGHKTCSVSKEQIVKSAKAVCNDVADKVKNFAKKTSDCEKNIVEGTNDEEDANTEAEAIEDDISAAMR